MIYDLTEEEIAQCDAELEAEGYFEAMKQKSGLSQSFGYQHPNLQESIYDKQKREFNESIQSSADIDPWDVESPDEIIEFNVDFFFRVFPEVSREKVQEVKEFVSDIVNEAVNPPITSAREKRPHEMPDTLFVKHAQYFLRCFHEVPNTPDRRDEIEKFIRTLWHEAQRYTWVRDMPPATPDREWPANREKK